jgi:hypothetical protein
MASEPTAAAGIGHGGPEQGVFRPHSVPVSRIRLGFICIYEICFSLTEKTKCQKSS